MKQRADERDGTVPETAKARQDRDASGRENLVAAIDASRDTTLERLLFALGIRDVGEIHGQDPGAALRRARCPDGGRRGSAARRCPTSVRWSPRRIAAFFHEPHNREVIAALRAAGVHWPEGAPQRASRGPLAGQTVVLTGALWRRCPGRGGAGSRRWAPRYPAACRRRPASWSPAKPPDPSWKRRRSLGVEIWDEARLLAFLAEHGTVKTAASGNRE